MAPPRAPRASPAAMRHARALPCDVARELARDSADVARLATYARAARCRHRRLPGSAERGHRATRVPRLPHLHERRGRACSTWASRCGPAWRAIAASRWPRWPQTGRVAPGRDCSCSPRPGSDHRAAGGAPEIRLRARPPAMPAPRPAGCWPLRHASWAAGSRAQSARRTRFIVLGDFNRGGPPGANDLFWTLLDPAALPGRRESAAFRELRLGRALSGLHRPHPDQQGRWQSRLPARSFNQLQAYHPRDAAHYHLSDHCPVSVSLNVHSAL